jgi:hypothetical protein
MFSRVTFSSKLDLVRIIRGIDDAADRLGLLDFLPLRPQYEDKRFTPRRSREHSTLRDCLRG